MVSERFIDIMKSGEGCAVIMAGSSSDEEHIGQVMKSLSEYNIPYQVRICSAHKQPEKLMDIIRDYDGVGGLVAYVAIAGGTDVLSGTLAYHTFSPVISCPPDKKGLESALTNPPGSSNAVVSNPKNIGKFIAQIFAGTNPRLRELLNINVRKKINELEQADSDYSNEFRGEE